MNIILLGCDGNAGANYIKCVRKAYPDAFIVGTGLNKYHLQHSDVDVAINLSGYESIEKLDLILKTIDQFNIDFIHAQPEQEVRWLIINQHFINQHANKSLTTGHDIVIHDRMRKKDLFAEIASEIHPTLKYAVNANLVNKTVQYDDIEELGGGTVWCRATVGSGSKYAMPCSSVSELEYWASYLNEHHGILIGDLMVSPYLPGKEYAVQTFFWHGELIHAGARERVQHVFAAQMASGQSSSPSVARSVNNEKVTQAAIDTIYLFGEPHGIYCVDLREDINYDPVPTEINYGRYFTTSNFMSSIGMNTPAKELEIHKRGFPVKEDYSIDDIDEDYFWIRQMDKGPYLTKGLQ